MISVDTFLDMAGLDVTGLEKRQRAVGRNGPSPRSLMTALEGMTIREAADLHRARMRSDLKALLERALEGEDSPELAEEGHEVWMLCDDQRRVDLAWFCCEFLDAELVQGAVLKDSWTHGMLGSPLTVTGYSHRRLMGWFRGAAPQTLMDETERKVFAALPDPLCVFRGGVGKTPKKAASGLGWTLDKDRAVFFADLFHRFFDQPRYVLQAEVPRSAVFAYLDDRTEREVVLNYRRVRNLTVLEGP